MTYIYNDSNIYSSSHIVRDPNDLDLSNIYPLADLYFCPTCQQPKSIQQCQYHIISKYCSNCLVDYTEKIHLKRCTKTCFECPRCEAIISINIVNHALNGKSFIFTCNYCPFQFETSVIEKPKSLHSIINQERSEREDFHDKLFNQLKKTFENQYDNNNETDTNTNSPLDELKLKNLNLTTLSSPTPIVTTGETNFKIDQKTDDITPRLNSIKFDSSSPLHHSNTYSSWQVNRRRFPLAKQLSIKYSLRCLTCNTKLLQPTIIRDSPSLHKFTIKLSAVDYLPIIKVTKYKTNVYLLNFINPLPSKCVITLSTTAQIPSQFINPPTSNKSIDVTIPINKFIIGPNINKSFIKNIPTALLTKNTSASLAELVSRKKSLQNSNVRMSTTSSQLQQFEEEEEEEIDFPKLEDKGSNWYTIPIHIAISQLRNATIKLPLHIKIKTELPSSFKSKEITAASITPPQKLSFKYWNIIELDSAI
ncbi:uncharacterized protein RJT21DRAFT_48821 [Scheffersomyces amazonensis]|uniref:uncharacterized protein n=1 Tax=Scheffersomyces amazonensis TaxID=1078765 RepID=UPI00315CA891